MDQASLVDMQKEAGDQLVDRLASAGIPVDGAAWLREAGDGQWYLYVATPLVSEEEGTRNAYRKVHAVIRQSQELGWLIPLEIKLVGPMHPVAKAVNEIHGRYPGPMPTELGARMFGGISVDGAYVYPKQSPASAASR